jgi:integrase
VLKVKKKTTARVVTKEDVELVLAVIRDELVKGAIDEEHARQFIGIVLFGAFIGQRPYSAIKQLRVEQFREALKLEKPIVHVEPAQDKIRMEHYVPLHPQLASAMGVLRDSRDESGYMFI